MSNSELVIRPARLEDYAEVCSLFDGVDVLHRERLPWLFKTPDVQPRSVEYFARLLEHDESSVIVADTGGSIVGVALAMLRSAPDLGVFVRQRWGVLDDLVVTSSWRRRGVGRVLMRAVEGAPWVELSVYDFNEEARRFYESIGYLPLRTVLRKPA